LYHVNITDIDDKIILKARQNKLVEDLKNNASVDFTALSAMASEAMVQHEAKLLEKINKAELAIEQAKQSGERRLEDEQVEEMKKLKQKEENFIGEQTAIVAAQTNPIKSREELFKAAQGILAEKLDRELGDTVTDHEVFNAHARKYEREFMEDMEALGIREPDVLTRVTEYVPQIIQFIEKIMAKGMAYASNGSVYLDLKAFGESHDYRKLSPTGDTTETELAESEGALGDANASTKQNKNDFALWKGSKPGEPEWESPWGMGRPGWHIECSVVASDILGEKLDLHAGGEDLKFPHHDNELCQSEACFGSQQWVNYFLHSGHLHIKGLKMSKSLKNFVTIRQALANHSARQLRILFLMQSWDDSMHFSDSTVEDARSKEKTFKSFFHQVKALARKDYLAEPVGWRMGELDQELSNVFLASQSGVHNALLNNFGTKEAMAYLCDLISKANIYMRTPQVQPAVLLLKRIAMYITHILRVFGVLQGSDDFGFPMDSSVESKESAVTPIMDALVSFRDRIRNAALKSKDPILQEIVAACDEMRDDALVHCGVRLEDKPDGATWNLESTAVLLAEKAFKEEAAIETKRRKQEALVNNKRKDLAKWESAVTKPCDMFRTPDYCDWDEEGLPTMVDTENPVSAKQQKKLKKFQEKQATLNAELLVKSGGNPDAFIASLQDELKQLEL